MVNTNQENSHFADTVLRTLLSLDAGQARVAVFGLARDGAVKLITVGGIWIGDVFSWRSTDGAHETIQEEGSTEIFGGQGDNLDASVAAVRLCWNLAQVAGNDAQWSVAV